MAMNRQTTCFDLPPDFSTEKLVTWANKFSVAVVLNSNRSAQTQKDKYGKYDLLAGVGSLEESAPALTKFETIEAFCRDKSDWYFGSLSYELKDELENLKSEHPDGISFPLIHFFYPRYVLRITGSRLFIDFLPEKDEEKHILAVFKELCSTEAPPQLLSKLSIAQRVKKQKYTQDVEKIKYHIHRGDIYEMNYCVEFYNEDAALDPVAVFNRLNTISPSPFSCFYKYHSHYALGASPERFLARRGNKLISQPIKGTARRGVTPEEDREIIASLRNDPKEQAENVMIVDLVRNDLSRTAEKGSVKVEELFGIYTFPKLHQMISTITSDLKPGFSSLDAIKAAFPMGSMTGAPKIRAMQLIEEFETARRGLYSGTIGYFDPEGDFDFNVVIRSIQYNSLTRYLSFMVGSAITEASDPEKEYEECLLKAGAMRAALGDSED